MCSCATFFANISGTTIVHFPNKGSWAVSFDPRRFAVPLGGDDPFKERSPHYMIQNPR